MGARGAWCRGEALKAGPTATEARVRCEFSEARFEGIRAADDPDSVITRLANPGFG